uniref:Uncharacterized protein n=1 Tax=Nelumbo nucifera TaxID=4432 RepID=A0A822XVN7_NELNU|nr:TPA_asm: hypothetical protein HUJ06_025276 [Nelumbo nucifera]
MPSEKPVKSFDTLPSWHQGSHADPINIVHTHTLLDDFSSGDFVSKPPLTSPSHVYMS